MYANALDNVLDELNKYNHAIEGALISSHDGLAMASVLDGDANEELISAMSSALFCMGARAGDEMGRGALEHVVALCERGYILLMNAGDEAILAILAQNNASLSDLLPSAMDAAQAISKILLAHPISQSSST